VSEVRCCPLQWRGRAGITPASEYRCSRRTIVDGGDHTGSNCATQELAIDLEDGEEAVRDSTGDGLRGILRAALLRTGEEIARKN
jgi:hypothetical protein